MLTSYSIKNIYSHFEYKELKKVEGDPTLDTVLLLHRQVKRNVQSVPTTLGGGQLGYLALVISKSKYDAIPNSTPFEKPQDPGLFEVHLPTTTDSTNTSLQKPVATTRRTTRSILRTTVLPTQEPAPSTTQPTVIFPQKLQLKKQLMTML